MNYFPKWTPIYHNNNYDEISTQAFVVIGNNKRAEFDPQTSVCLAYMYNVHPQLSSTLIFIVATLEKFLSDTDSLSNATESHMHASRTTHFDKL